MAYENSILVHLRQPPMIFKSGIEVNGLHDGQLAQRYPARHEPQNSEWGSGNYYTIQHIYLIQHIK